MKKQIFISTSAFLMAFMPLVAEISTVLNKHTLCLNESLSLDFTAPQQAQSQPDFSPLQTDFEILSCQQSFATTVVNGRVNAEMHWQLKLQPKREGLLEIPSITIGNEQSPLQIVTVTAAKKAQHDDTIFLETELTPNKTAYERTQILYTIRLYRATNLAQAGLSEVKVNDPDAIVERIGTDTEYEHMHQNGTRYLVLERKYMIFPQHEGELEFAPIVFEGQILKGGHSFFNMQTEYKRLTSATEKMTIQPIPAPFTKDNWFAAKDVKLSEEWSKDPSTLIAGEPVTWTVSIAANGSHSSNIPDVSFNIPSNIKHYLDKPETTTTSQGTDSIGTKKIKVALIATEEGSVTLPEINIKWWDLERGKSRVSSLAARTLTVQGAPIALLTPQNEAFRSDNGFEKIDADGLHDVNLPLWAWGLIALNSIWIVSGLRKAKNLLFKKRKRANPTVSLKASKDQIKRACYDNDPKRAEKELLSWGESHFKTLKPLNLISLKEQLSGELQREVEILNQVLYGRKEHWDGKAFWEAFKSYNPPKIAKDKVSQEPLLAKLYPDSI